MSEPCAARHTPGLAGIADAAAAQELLRHDDDSLFASATQLREAHFGHTVELCAIINVRSGRCGMDCAFCAQSSRHHTAAPVYATLPPAELDERLARLRDMPLRHVGLVTSGGALAQDDVDQLASVISALPPQWEGRLCASLGRLPAQALLQLKAAGLTRFHHNLETSRAYYPHICTTQTWDERRATVLRAQNAGFSVCCGGLFGMGESWDDRIAFALHLRELGITQVPINFLHPHKGTPLARKKTMEAREALRIIALFRHILPAATLRVCGGRPLVLGAEQHRIFAAGANALMTGDYLTTQGAALDADCRMIAAQGLRIRT